MKLKIPPLLLTLLAALMMLGLDQVIPLDLFAPEFKWVIITLLLLLATSVLLWAGLGFRRQNTTVNPMTPEQVSALVVKGLYRYSRNPMYCAMALYLVACMLWLGNPLTGLVVILFVVYMNQFQIKPEEQALEQKFGQDFINYREKVRRWI